MQSAISPIPLLPLLLQGKGQFSKEELKQLFMLRNDTACDTYDILQVGMSPEFACRCACWE